MSKETDGNDRRVTGRRLKIRGTNSHGLDREIRRCLESFATRRRRRAEYSFGIRIAKQRLGIAEPDIKRDSRGLIRVQGE